MAATPSVMVPLGTLAPDFRLPDTDGTLVSRSSFSGSPLLVAFISNHCPFVKHIQSSFAQLAREYQAKGVGVVAINSNDVANYPDDSPAKMIEEKKNVGYTFPYLFDESQSAAKEYRAACTPDFFLFDSTHQLVYRGQMDASRPSNNKPNDGADLRSALDAVLTGKAVSSTQIPSIGCNIKWKPGNEPNS